MPRGLLYAVFLATVTLTGTTYATTWSLSSRVMTQGGSLQVRSDAPITSANGTVQKNYTTSRIVPVALQAATGYQISAVTVNGTNQTLPTPNPISMGLPAFTPIKTSQSLTVSFAKHMTTVSASATSGGTVTPNGSASYQSGTPVSFTFAPNSGYSVVSISGIPVGATLQSASSGATVTLPYRGSVKVAFTVSGTPVTMAGSFFSLIASAGAPQTGMVGTRVTLAGSSVVYDGAGSVSYAWSQTAGTPVAMTGANTATPYFTATVPGNYQFSLVVTDSLGATSSAQAVVTVVNSAAAAGEGQCQGCHTSDSLDLSANVFGKWSSSRHKASLVMCAQCHVGADTGSHPGTLIGGTVNETTFSYVSSGANFCTTCHNPSIVTAYSGSPHPSHSVTCSSCHTNGVHNTDFNATACDGCHRDSSGNVALHPIAIGTTACISCHDPHATTGSAANMTAAHYNNFTGAGYPASYVTSRSSCSDCHYYDPSNLTIRQQWYTTGHAATKAPAWTAYDFKTKSGCVQCHTTTGFIAYSTGRVTAAWGAASDKTKELLTCIGCHSDITTGAVRGVTPIKPFADDSYLNRNLGTSNVCMDCHSGTNNGKSIQVKVGSADFTQLPFVAPHYMAAGGTLHGQAGYHFPGRTYSFYSSNTHRSIGIANNNGTGTGGPCVACHMSATDQHHYQAVTADPSGTISAITSPLCANCHKTYLSALQLDADRVSFENALVVLQAMLAKKQITYSASYPYFSTTNWGAGQAGANTMGAAFNYVLLVNEPGAFAHNSQYAKQLVLDSIDFLDDGSFNDSAASTAATLAGSGAITQAVADSFVAYKGKNLCTSCHGGTSSSTSPMASAAHPAHLSLAYGPGSYLGSDLSSCETCHLYSANTHANGTVDLISGTGSACQGCHAGAAPTWSAGVRLGCTSCHAATPAVLPNGVAAPYKGSFASAGHGQYPASNQCTSCHDAGSSHISGTLGSYNRLLQPSINGQCASCHNTTMVSAAFRNMSTHVDLNGNSLNCSDCHDPHGTGNLYMIRSNIKGSTISFTDDQVGLVDPNSNRGLCQVCHTLTNHYRAGVPETSHFTSGCLGCHSHNSAGGAFRPMGGCDACHGYPPAPKNTGASFGSAGNWANARFEDYSGGGGAHLVKAHVAPGALPADGWANCAVCHNAGQLNSTPYHKMLTPVSNHIDNVTVLVDPKLRFNRTFTVYTSSLRVNPPAANATGNCFNISCHMSPSARWSTER